ncbi:hypothetical protein D7223_30385 [Micromonospora endolithica]|uniref:Uncharacterized protein n=1 Tax=Micromonospora endolithica TaxID=230091 RepID=A0A3A9YTR1_9ACTN|nr:hypothetical protein D7223_30385 [Micromonospora endolithica]
MIVASLSAVPGAGGTSAGGCDGELWIFSNAPPIATGPNGRVTGADLAAAMVARTAEDATCTGPADGRRR